MSWFLLGPSPFLPVSACDVAASHILPMRLQDHLTFLNVVSSVLIGSKIKGGRVALLLLHLDSLTGRWFEAVQLRNVSVFHNRQEPGAPTAEPEAGRSIIAGTDTRLLYMWGFSTGSTVACHLGPTRKCTRPAAVSKAGSVTATGITLHVRHH